MAAKQLAISPAEVLSSGTPVFYRGEAEGDLVPWARGAVDSLESAEHGLYLVNWIGAGTLLARGEDLMPQAGWWRRQRPRVYSPTAATDDDKDSDSTTPWFD
jgi:hypothetical protein